MLTGKQLSAFLQILRANGVTHFRSADLDIDLAAKAPAVAPAPEPEASQIGTDPEDKSEEDEIGDPRFLLEKLATDFTKRHQRAA